MFITEERKREIKKLVGRGHSEQGFIKKNGKLVYSNNIYNNLEDSNAIEIAYTDSSGLMKYKRISKEKFLKEGLN